MNYGTILDGIERAAANRIKQNPEDYLVDGLLYCGKCHTKKQTRFKDIEGKIRTPMCLCECEAKKREEAEQRRIEEERLEHIRELRKMGFPDAELIEATFSHDDGENAKLTTITRNYAEHFDELKKNGKGLLLFGDVGTGKTFAAACIANALIDRGIPCLVTSFARIVNTIGGSFEKQSYYDSLNEFDLLVIDDLASERDTEYMQEIVMTVVDARYRSGLPLIVTTNLTGDELKHPSDIRKKRIYSRLLEMCIPFEVKGQDRRQKKLKTDYKEFSELLGI